jgi:hypothetical protein
MQTTNLLDFALKKKRKKKGIILRTTRVPGTKGLYRERQPLKFRAGARVS